MNKFIIVGTQRTGSSPFAECLGLHPMITCGWEWMLPIPYRGKFKIADIALSGDFTLLKVSDQDHMKAVHHLNSQWLGFRWLFSSSAKWFSHPRLAPALWIDRFESFIQWVSKRPEIHIIHIVRNNNIDWLKSVYLARKANSYSKERYPEGIKVRIPNREAVRRLRAKNWVDSRLDTLRNSNPFILVHYENFLKNQKDVVDRAISFLNCDPAAANQAKSQLKKQSKGKASDYIKNYDELIETLVKHDLAAAKTTKEGYGYQLKK